MTTALISLNDVKLSFDDGHRQVPVLHGIDLTLARGEALGMVGESGCGKSVTWLAVLKLLGPTARLSGDVRLDGVSLAAVDESGMAAIRGCRIGMIFQDPGSALNPVHRIGYQLAESVSRHQGLDAAASRREALRLLDRVRIPNAAARLGSYPHELSGGMNQRVMIAMALAGRPDLLIADEPTTALDVTIQAQILDLLQDIRKDSGMALVLVSHDLGVVAEVCERVVVMYAGRIVESAPAEVLFAAPRHPYTRGLLDALPDPDGPRRRLRPISGTVPVAGRRVDGCSFAPRCPEVATLCRQAVPGLYRVRDETDPRRMHRAACHRIADDRSIDVGRSVRPGESETRAFEPVSA